MKRTIDRYEMLAPGDAVLVALSGGPDSTALLAVMASVAEAYDVRVYAAHLNHQLRADARRDQEWAQALAAQFGVRCVVGTAGRLAGRSNLEARARRHRYRFLAAAAAQCGCTKIATGHTLDDQAETVIMRLLRGTGADGLAGIPPVREGRIIRPLIECGRAEVLAFLQEQGLFFCEDSTNQDRRFLRNRIRHDVLPLLNAIQAGVTRHMVSTAAVVAAEGAWLDEVIAARLAAASGDDGNLAVDTVVGTPPALRGRLVRAWLRRQRRSLRAVSAAHVYAIIELALGKHPNAEVRLPAGQSVARSYGVLRFGACAAPLPSEPVYDLLPGSTVQLASGWRLQASPPSAGTGERPADLWTLTADADVVQWPLAVRTARPGDRVQPLGMRGHRKLQDVFVDRKLPRAARGGYPVVEAGGEILWVPGLVRSTAALVTAATRSTLRLVAEKGNVAGPLGMC